VVNEKFMDEMLLFTSMLLQQPSQRVRPSSLASERVFRRDEQRGLSTVTFMTVISAVLDGESVDK
jgi:hypothetical protein